MLLSIVTIIPKEHKAENAPWIEQADQEYSLVIDALLDLIELDVNDDLLKQQMNKAVCELCMSWLEKMIKAIYLAMTIYVVKKKC